MKRIIKMLEIRYIDDQDGLQEAYDSIYTSPEPIRHLDSFYQWIFQLLEPVRGKRLLDVACGQGAIPELAAQHGLSGHGFDLSLPALREASGNGVYLIVANGEFLPYPDTSFDNLTNIGSLEHFIDPAAGAREMARVLTPDGRACILLPNSFSVSNMVHAWHTGRTCDDGQPIQRFAAQMEWRELLEENGLRIEKAVKYERVFPRSLHDALWYVKRPKNVGWLFLTPFIPLNLANSFVFICRRQT